MNAFDPFSAKVDAITARDPRFDREAYLFVRDALEFTTRQYKKKPSNPEIEQHVSGQQLLEGVRRYALEQYGPMVPTVFEHWRVHSCEDIGAIVFNLIEAREFGKAETDTLDDFRGGFDFHEAFVKPFRPVASSSSPEAPDSRRAASRPAKEHT